MKALLLVLLGAALLGAVVLVGGGGVSVGDERVPVVERPSAPAQPPRTAPESVTQAVTWRSHRDPDESASERVEVVRAVRVEVLVLSALAGRGEPVGGVACEVGFGYAAEDGALLEHRVVLARGTSDASGRFEVELEVPVELEREQQQLRVFGRAAEIGYQRRDSSVVVSLDEDVGLELTVVAKRGGTISGRVLDPAGQPVEVNVSLMAAAVQAASAWTSSGQLSQAVVSWRDRSRPGEARSNREGEFALHYVEVGDCWVYAEAEEVGTGLSGKLALDGLQSVAGLVVRLAGPGRLMGRVVDLEGSPVRDLWLRAELVDELHTSPLGAGFPGISGKTNRHGRFDFGGLAPGMYRIRASKRVRTNRYPWSLTPDPVSSQAGELELVFRCRTLVLSVEDSAGRPVRVGLRFRGRLRDGKVDAFVERCDAEGRVRGSLGSLSGAFPERLRTPGGGLVAYLEEGATYVFGVASLDRPLREHYVTASGDRVEIRRTIRLGPNAEPGTLRVTIEDSDGESLEGRSRVRVLAPRSRLVLFDSTLHSRQGAYEVRLPPGSYEVAIGSPRAQIDWSGGGISFSYGSQDRPAAVVRTTVASGATTQLHQKLEAE